MYRRILVAATLVAATTACGSGIREIEVEPVPSALRAVADSTVTLVSVAAYQSDTAMVKARVATIARSLGDARSLVLGARSSIVTARGHVASAMRQGDWLGNVVATEEKGQEYARYWTISRVKLDEARARSAIAVAVADSTLSCTETECAAEGARRMQAHVEAAAGAAREAESMVRVALVHVR